MAQAKKAEAVEPVDPVEAPRTWGPFREYTYISTEHGEYGVPAGKVLHFEDQVVHDYKAGRDVVRPRPVWTPVVMKPAKK